MNTWFWNARERRLRAGWRVLIQAVLVAGLAYGLYYAGMFKGRRLVLARMQISFLVVTLVVVWASGRFLDRRRFRDFGLTLRERGWWADYGFGLLIGVLQAGGFIAIALALGWIQITPNLHSLDDSLPLALAVAIDMITFTSVGVMEELGRGYQIRNLVEGLANTRLRRGLALPTAVAVASLFSMLMHVNREGPSFWVYVFLGTLLYGVGYLLTGRIAFAVGLHSMWDFFISTIVALGGAAGSMNAAALFSAPLTGLGLGRGMDVDMAVLGLVLDAASVPLLLAYVRARRGTIAFVPAMVTRTPLRTDHTSGEEDPVLTTRRIG